MDEERAAAAYVPRIRFPSRECELAAREAFLAGAEWQRERYEDAEREILSDVCKLRSQYIPADPLINRQQEEQS